MDVNATLREINDFLASGQTGDEVDEWCEAIHQWIVSGGFEPDWNKYPLATSYYKSRQARLPYLD